MNKLRVNYNNKTADSAFYTDDYGDTYPSEGYVEHLESLLTPIPVSERLPTEKDGKYVFVKSPSFSRFPVVAFLSESCSCETLFYTEDGCYALRDVTHWLPLPQMEV